MKSFPKRHHQVFAAHPASFSESNSTASCCEFSNATCQCLTDKAGTALFEVLCQSLLHHPPKQMQMEKRPLNKGKKRTFSCYSCLCSKIYRWSMHQSTQHAGLLWHQLRLLLPWQAPIMIAENFQPLFSFVLLRVALTFLFSCSRLAAQAI